MKAREKMENKDSNVIFDALVMTITLIIIGFMAFVIRQNIKQNDQIAELSRKLDAVASDTDVKLGNMNMRLATIETDIVTVKDDQIRQTDELNSKLTDSMAKIKAKVDALENKIKEQETTTEETTDEITTEDTIGQEETSYKVGAASIIKLDNEHGGITEIDDEEIKHANLPTGAHLTPSSGIFWFGNQLETYYNLDMSVIVEVAHQNGIAGEYWVREDGCKMLGEYIMLACNRDVHPYGSIVETSLGMGISLDTGGFAANNPLQVDIAVTW